MNAPFLAPLQRLRRRARRVLLMRGIGLVLSASITSTTVAVALDWLIHLDDTRQRGLLLLGVLLVHVAATWRWLIVPLSAPLSDLALAARIEQRFPVLRDQLSSGLQFVHDHNAPTTGSATLKQGVIDSAVETLHRVDIDTVIERRTADIPVLLAAGSIVVGLALAAGNPLDVNTGLSRLFVLSADQWPRKVDLQFLDSSQAPASWNDRRGVRLPAGESIPLRVINTRGDLPDDSVIELRHAANRRDAARLLAVQSLDRSPRTDTTTIGSSVLVPPEGFEALECRARGGDDETPWIPLASIPPPLIESLQVTLHPPAYTTRSTRALPEGHGDIEAWIGTRATITAVINQPIRQATLVRGDQPALPVSIASDGRHLTTEFTIQTPGVSTWFLALVDREGLTVERPEQFELRGRLDRLPEVEMVEPHGNTLVTPQAQVPLTITAHDDLGLADVHLVIRPINAPGAVEKRILLHGPHPGEGLLQIDFSWQLADESLVAGMEFDVHVEATDTCDVEGPRIGRSATRTISIVSLAAKRDQLDARQAVLLEQLTRVLHRQRQTAAQVELLSIQCETTGRLRPGDRETLLATEVNQQQLDAQLAATDSALTTLARAMRQERKDNRIDDRGAIGDLKRIIDSLEDLSTQEIPELEATFANARRQLDSTPTTNPEHTLKTIHDLQLRVITVLGQLVETVAPSQDRRERLGEARQIIDQQQQLLDDTASRPEETLDQSPQQLARQHQADLRRMASQQHTLAERLDRLGRRIQPEHPGEDRAQQTAQRLKLALDILHKSGTVAAMRESAAHIRENHIGEAQQNQQQILKQLGQLERSLQDDATSTAKDNLSRIDHLLIRIRQLIKAQSALRIDTGRDDGQPTPGPNRPRLETRQAGLCRNAQQIVDMIRPLGLPEGKARARQVADTMTLAIEAIGKSKPTVSTFQATAIEQLELLERLVTKQRRQIATTLDAEQIRRAYQDLQRVRTLQEQLSGQTRGLEEQRLDTGRWTRPLLKELRELVGRQESITETTRHISGPTDGQATLQPTLEAIARQMQSATESLRRRDPGPQTQQRQDRILEQLDQWLSRTRIAIPRESTANGPKTAASPSRRQPDTSKVPGDSPMNRTDTTTSPGSHPGRQSGPGHQVGKAIGTVRLESLKQAPWGNLPPALRQRLSQSGRERPPTRYTELVRRYYETLAGHREQDNGKTPKEPR